MNKTIPIVFILFVFLACQKKAVPVITGRTQDPPAPVKPVLTIKPDTLAGRTVFTNRCGRCHDLPQPGQYTAERWDGILSYMIPRARLNEEQGIHVTAYLKAHAATK